MEEEYEIQHFGFSVAELKKETTDMIHGEIDKACDLLVESITTIPQVDGNIAAEIDRKKNDLASDIKELLKDSLDEMGNIMTDHFSIPRNVTLSTDQLKLKSIDVDEERLEKELDERVKHFMRLEQFFNALSDELESYNKNENLLQQQESILDMCERQLMAAQSDLNYIDEQAARVNTNF
ncbi:hypothetical protein HA402_001252 [Bradysia odoriphaga]|nr:hypothetical protein HA402_001252 [Bradysia odoriphaga]